MDRYKILPLKLYKEFCEEKEHFEKEKEASEKLKELPKPIQIKVAKLLQALREGGMSVDETNLKNILPYALYAIRGKERPENFEKFLNYLAKVKIPRGLLCQKVIKDAKKVRKQ